MKLDACACAAALALVTAAAHADTISLVGSLTANDPVFNRPFTLTSLSAVGTAVHYDAFTFGGVTPGSYTFTMVTGPAPATFDSFLALYAGGFNPTSPLTNLVAINDDLNGSFTSSGFAFTLNATTLYTVVSTAYANTGLGNYTTTITNVVPEPDSYAMFAAGLIGLAGWMRRNRRQA